MLDTIQAETTNRTTAVREPGETSENKTLEKHDKKENRISLLNIKKKQGPIEQKANFNEKMKSPLNSSQDRSRSSQNTMLGYKQQTQKNDKKKSLQPGNKITTFPKIRPPRDGSQDRRRSSKNRL